MIRNKEDFKGKCIKIPQNISEKKFDRIEDKLLMLGFNTWRVRYYDIQEYNYLSISHDNPNVIAMWNKKGNKDKSRKQKKIDKYYLSLQQISIKEFLKDESNDYTVEIDLNTVRLNIITTGCNLKVKYKDYKPRKFKTAEEAIKWMYNNPMKEISYEMKNDTAKFKERFNPKVGLLDKQKYFECKRNYNAWKFDKDCLAKNFDYVNDYWKNIRECKYPKIWSM